VESPAAEALRHRIQEGSKLPRHVAVIMDGNGRWARKRGLARLAGHKAGRKPVREVVEGARALGIEVVTLYTFSIENWNRPRAEVLALMRFLRETLRDERDELRKNGVRLATIGRTDDLPAEVRDELQAPIDHLSGGTELLLILALSYGGRAEIVDAARTLARRVGAGELDPDAIDDAVFEEALYTRGVPPPDLLIRTSGELRISNFLLWQLAYAEIYVTDILWPDFDREAFYQAILDFQTRERRFGRVD